MIVGALFDFTLTVWYDIKCNECFDLQNVEIDQFRNICLRCTKFFVFTEYQLIAFAPYDNSLSSNQDTNWFSVQAGIKPQISYLIIRDFTNWANWNLL